MDHEDELAVQDSGDQNAPRKTDTALMAEMQALHEQHRDQWKSIQSDFLAGVLKRDACMNELEIMQRELLALWPEPIDPCFQWYHWGNKNEKDSCDFVLVFRNPTQFDRCHTYRTAECVQLQNLTAERQQLDDIVFEMENAGMKPDLSDTRPLASKPKKVLLTTPDDPEVRFELLLRPVLRGNLLFNSLSQAVSEYNPFDPRDGSTAIDRPQFAHMQSFYNFFDEVNTQHTLWQRSYAVLHLYPFLFTERPDPAALQEYRNQYGPNAYPDAYRWAGNISHLFEWYLEQRIRVLEPNALVGVGSKIVKPLFCNIAKFGGPDLASSLTYAPRFWTIDKKKERLRKIPVLYSPTPWSVFSGDRTGVRYHSVRDRFNDFPEEDIELKPFDVAATRLKRQTTASATEILNTSSGASNSNFDSEDLTASGTFTSVSITIHVRDSNGSLTDSSSNNASREAFKQDTQARSVHEYKCFRRSIADLFDENRMKKLATKFFAGEIRMPNKKKPKPKPLDVTTSTTSLEDEDTKQSGYQTPDASQQQSDVNNNNSNTSTLSTPAASSGTNTPLTSPAPERFNKTPPKTPAKAKTPKQKELEKFAIIAKRKGETLDRFFATGTAKKQKN